MEKRAEELPPAHRRTSIPSPSLEKQRISRLQFREAREVSVGRPELGDTVAETERGDGGIVHLGARHLSGSEESCQHGPIVGGLTQQHEARRGEQSRYLLHSAWHLRRRAVNVGMGGD